MNGSEDMRNGAAANAASDASEPHEAQPHAPPRHWHGGLSLLCILAVIAMLYWSRAVCIPVMMGVLISYALAPVVEFMHARHVPRAVGAAVVLLGMVGGLSTMAYTLSDDAVELIQVLPEAAENLSEALHAENGGNGVIADIGLVLDQLREATNSNGDEEITVDDGVTRVQIDEPPVNIVDFLRLGTLGALAVAGQAGIVIFLVFFLLIAGDTFRRKLVRIAGPTFTRKKITLQLLDEITDQIQRYLLVQVVTSMLVGFATWLTFLWIGLENAALWGLAAGVLNTIPYLGPVVVTGGTAIVAFLQFDSLGMAILVAGVSLLITSLEGFLLTPWLIGRASRMNAVAVFVSVLFWGWLWGVWGLLLGLPIVMAIKAVCDRVEDFKPVGELLGE